MGPDLNGKMIIDLDVIRKPIKKAETYSPLSGLMTILGLLPSSGSLR